MSSFSHVVSEDFQILLNLTDPIRIEELDYYSETFQSFDTYDNNSGIFTFLRGEQRNNESFVVMLNHASANSYSKALWDGDLALVIYASNLTSNMQFKVRERERERECVCVMVFELFTPIHSLSQHRLQLTSRIS